MLHPGKYPLLELKSYAPQPLIQEAWSVSETISLVDRLLEGEAMVGIFIIDEVNIRCLILNLLLL